MANNIRSYFGDGSEFGVRMVYATEETPLGTAGSVRNAIDELDERFLVISGDVLTDIDLTAIVKEHDEKQALATIGLVARREPARVRHRHHPRRRLDRAVPREAVVGPGVQRHDQHRHLRARARDLRLHRARPRRSTSRPRCSPRSSTTGKPLYGAVAEGYWEDVGTLESLPLAPTRTSSTAGCRSTSPASRWATASGWARGPRSTPTPRSSGPAVIGENCRIEAGVRLGPYTVLGTNVRVRANADLERVVVHDNSYLGEGVRLRGAIVGRSCDLRGGVRGEEGVVLGDECFVGEHAVLASGREGVPVQDRRAGRGHQLLDRVGEPGLPLAVRAGRRGRPGQRRHHARAGHPGGHGLRHHPQEGRHDHHVARLEPVGPDAEAGDDGRRSTPPASTCSTSRWRRCRSPGSSSAGPSTPAALTIRLVEGDPQSCVIRFFDTNGADLSEDAQRKVERLFGREDFRRVFPAEIGDIGFPPRALEQYTAALEATVDIEAIRSAQLQGGGRLRATAPPRSSCRTSWPSSAPTSSA